MREINYIPFKDVFDEVKVFYNSYFEAGHSIDEAVVIPSIRYLLRKFSLPIHSIKSTVIDVKNYEADLPLDFHKLTMALACFKTTEFIPAPESQPLNITEFSTDYKINYCEETPCVDGQKQYIQIIQRIDNGQAVTYGNITPLSVTSKSYQSCDKDCFNHKIKSQDEINILKDKVQVNFQTGAIYLEYYTSLLTDQGYMIPDNEIIINAVREKTKEMVLEYLMVNTTSPVSQLYGNQVKKAQIAEIEASTMIKTPEYNTVMNVGRYMQLKYKKYENLINKY